MVSMALGLDYRISPKFLNAGVGYGGSCFPKDVKAIAHTARQHGYTARLFEEVAALNERQKQMMLHKIRKAFNNNLEDKTFAVLGLSFKPKTSDMREAPSESIINELLKAGARVKTYDPEAINEAKRVFENKITYSQSPEEAVKGSDAIIIATEWDEFRNLDLAELRKIMADNKLFDGRNIYEPELARDDGFEYYGVGRR